MFPPAGVGRFGAGKGGVVLLRSVTGKGRGSVKASTHWLRRTNRKRRAAAPCLCFESSRSINIVVIGDHKVIHVL